MRNNLVTLPLLVAVLLSPSTARTAAPTTAPTTALGSDTMSRIDTETRAILTATGVPGASIAIVRNDRIVAARAYGLAEIASHVAMRPDMILPIGSVSKQFTAALVLLLAQDKKLSLDDHVARWFPQFSGADRITIRMLLQHTAGYPDDWPEDYVTPTTMTVTTPIAIANDWARRPLDFPPGTQFQYSNSGYLVAALIAERAGGAAFFAQLRARILAPLHLDTAFDFAAADLPPGAPIGYEAYALATPHPSPHNATAWEFGDGELAMTASDLATWDIALIDRTVLRPASYVEMETEASLPGGKGSGYGLGVEFGRVGGHRFISHSGEEPGFVSADTVYPDDRDAVVVLTNQDASPAAGMIARAIARIAFGIGADGTQDNRSAARIIAICRDLASGKLDRGRLTANASAYFTPAAIAAYRTSLQSLGLPLGITETSHEMRAGMTFRVYRVTYASRTVDITTYEEPDGTLDQFLMVR